MNKITWIKGKCDFTTHHMRETLNPWKTIYPIFRDFEWKTCQFQHRFTYNCWNYVSWTSMGIHNIEPNQNVIPWNAENCFRARIFCQHEFQKSDFEMDCLYLGHCIAKIISQINVCQYSQPCKDKIIIFLATNVRSISKSKFVVPIFPLKIS